MFDDSSCNMKHVHPNVVQFFHAIPRSICDNARTCNAISVIFVNGNDREILAEPQIDNAHIPFNVHNKHPLCVIPTKPCKLRRPNPSLSPKGL